MLIVLEGCDGSGKTTLANQLKKSLYPGAEIIHCTRDTPNDFKFFWSIIEASSRRDIIVDRFCYGQFVYQKPEERKLSQYQLSVIELSMIEVGARVIYVCAPYSELIERLSKRREITSLPVSDILFRYSNLFDTTLIKPYVWDTGRNT